MVSDTNRQVYMLLVTYRYMVRRHPTRSKNMATIQKYTCYGCGCEFQTSHPTLGETDEGQMPFCAECVTNDIRLKIARRIDTRKYKMRATESKDGPEIRIKDFIIKGCDIEIIKAQLPPSWDYMISAEPIIDGSDINGPVMILYQVP